MIYEEQRGLVHWKFKINIKIQPNKNKNLKEIYENVERDIRKINIHCTTIIQNHHATK